MVVVLENGETWGIATQTGTNPSAGALYGNTTSSGTTLSGTGSQFNLVSGTVTSASYAGTFVAKSSITVNLSDGSTFNGTYNPEYDQPASLAALAGTFSGGGLTRNSSALVSVTVDPSGAITVPISQGCSASGTATPRPSGKNVFNVTVTFNGTSCALGDGTSTSGIALYESTSRSLLLWALNGATSDGFIFGGGK
ncbi:MAG: hypothetical protein P4L96_19575 [Rhodoferax sp.]|nr:hypothetical protein [Rhodoferax sp.]